jgi:hypothetical protein
MDTSSLTHPKPGKLGQPAPLSAHLSERMPKEPRATRRSPCLWKRALYNRDETESMTKAKVQDAVIDSVPRWGWALVGLVLFSLVISLATRTFHDTSSCSATVQSNTPQAIRQHMDRDAVRWAVPVAKMVVSLVPTFYPRVAPTGPPLATLLLDEKLYYRPPPVC